MKTRHAAQIRRGITEARAGNNLEFKSEPPLTIEAFIRTNRRLAQAELCRVLNWAWHNDGNGPESKEQA